MLVLLLMYEIVLKIKLCFSQFSHFGCPKPVFPRTVFTGKYHGKNRVLSKKPQPWNLNHWEMLVKFESKGNKFIQRNGFENAVFKSCDGYFV